jgi:hypothetical protein
MKYFGEYLVEKQIVSAENLVKALLEQTHKQPLAAQIAYDKKVLSPEEMIKVFGYQQDHSLDFISAGKQSGILTQEKYQQLEQELKRHQVPLSSLLLKNGSAGVKDLVHGLDEFLSTAKAPTNIPSVMAPKTTTKETSDADTFQFHKVESTFCAEIENALTPNRLSETFNVLQLIKQNASNKDLVVEFFQDVLRNVHTLRGLARAAKTPVIDRVCSLMDSAILKELRSGQPNAHHITDRLIPAIEKSFNFCASLKEALIRDGSEEVFWKNPATQRFFYELNNQLTVA